MDHFLNDKINFLDIPNVIEQILDKHDFINNLELEDINYLTDWTKQYIKGSIHD